MERRKAFCTVLLLVLGLIYLAITIKAFQPEVGKLKNAKMPVMEELREAGVYSQEFLYPEGGIHEESHQVPFGGFIENQGQTPDDIAYYFDQNNCRVYFKESAILFSNREVKTSFTIQFPGAAIVHPIGRKLTNYSINYFLSDLYKIDIPTYEEVWYYDLYQGIDLRYYMSMEGLKYEFIIHPLGDPTKIAIQLSEPLILVVTPERITVQTGTARAIVFEDYNLNVFQADGTAVRAQFIRHQKIDRSYGIMIETYDKSQELIIDPLITYSTYLGGDSSDLGYSIAVDSAGNTYITGYTESSDFPTQNPYQTFQGGRDVFVTKLNATGNGLVYSTYLGGDSDERAFGIAVDLSGNAYVTGETWSSNFPTQNPYQTFQGESDVFVTKLNANGNGLVYSTYLGGNSYDHGYSIAVDSAGNAYVTGDTESSNFPTMNPYQTYQGFDDVFVTKLNATGNGLVYSSYLGGNYGDSGHGIAVDSAGNAYITGDTESSNFPTQNPYQTYQGFDDVFVTKLNATGNELVYSTYLGGNNDDYGQCIAVDSSGNAYVTGRTQSSDFPTQNPYQTFQGDIDAFVTKLNTTGNGLVYSTYLGGNIDDGGKSIAVDSAGNTYVTGNTDSSDFPTQNPYQTYQGSYDVFVTKLNATGNGLVYSTYLGGNTIDVGTGIVVDSAGNAYVTGRTTSNNFPTMNPYQTDQTDTDVFVTKLLLPIIVNIDSPTATTYATDTITISLSGNADYYWYYIAGEDDSNQSWTENVDRTLVDGTYTLHAYGNESVGNEAHQAVTFTIDTTPPTLTIDSPTTTTYVTDTITVSLSGDADYYWYYIAGEDSSNQSWTINVDRILADGTYTLHAYGNESVGNEAHQAVTFTIDTTPPTLTIDSPTTTTYVTDTITVSLSGDADYYWYYIAGEDSSNQSWTTNVGRTLVDGIYTLHAYANDSVDNEAHVSIAFSIDTTTITTIANTATTISTSSTTTMSAPVITPGFEIFPLILGISVIFVVVKHSRRKR